MNRILNISDNVNYDDSISDIEYHSHTPYSSNSLKNSDEIRIPVHQQDVYTLPSGSFLLIEGKVIKSADNTDDTTTDLITNAMSFLFDEIRYEICGTEVDRVKNVGITTMMKNILTSRPSDEKWMQNAGWKVTTVGVLDEKTSFSFCVPLKLLLGFAEDYNHILLNVKQELILLRASSDKNVVFQSAAALHDIKLALDKVVWKVPYVRVEDNTRLSLLKITDRDQPISIPFRKWQLYEYPTLPASKLHSWTVKTSSMMEKPRYVILGFQTDRKDKSNKNASHFDLCKLENVKLYLNAKYYPYDNFNGSKSLMYQFYASFQSSYYNGADNQPCLDKETFIAKVPLFVIDCSKQTETIKTGSLDIRIDFQTSEDIPANTSAYCLIIHDALVQYLPLTGTVRKLM